MNSPTPVTPPVGLAPSSSTNLTLIGGFVTSIVIWILSRKGIFLPAGIEAAIAGLVAAIAGYFPTSGRK